MKLIEISLCLVSYQRNNNFVNIIIAKATKKLVKGDGYWIVELSDNYNKNICTKQVQTYKLKWARAKQFYNYHAFIRKL